MQTSVNAFGIDNEDATSETLRTSQRCTCSTITMCFQLIASHLVVIFWPKPSSKKIKGFLQGMVAAAEYVKKKLIQEGKLKHMLEIAKVSPDFQSQLS